MIKSSLNTPAYEKVFIRQALLDNSIRLDGRGVDDYRELSIQLERSESSSTSEVQLGNTIVVAVITGEIVPPFPDRPVEGILQFSSRVSPQTELTGISPWELTRMLERSLKHSEALDTESLCIVGGEKVWQINCDINIIDGSGGNIIDVCMLSVISALKAFRKPDISVIPCIYEEDDIKQPVKGFGLAPISGTGRPNVNILVHHSNNREPLPLALHHTPITVTLGVVKGYMTPVKSTTEEPAARTELKTLLLTDPSREEEAALDGKITFSVNAHNELCALSKPAGRGLTAVHIVHAAKIASVRAALLHTKLNIAIDQLEERVKSQRQKELVVLQTLNQHSTSNTTTNISTTASNNPNKPTKAKSEKTKIPAQAVGIDRNDPILQWSSLHQAAGLWEE